IELTLEPPAGLTIVEIVYPEPKDLKQAGSDQLLSVFERDFSIGVVLDIAPDTKVGEITVPAVLKYQACDEKQCYFPLRLKTAWTLHIVGPGAPIKAVNSAAMGQIAFGRGEKPEIRLKPDPTSEGGGTKSGTNDGGGTSEQRARAGIAMLDNFRLAGTTGYSDPSEFVQFIRDAEA